MQFEDLQLQWQRLDTKFERTLMRQRELLRMAAMRPLQSRVKRMAIWPALDIAGCLGVAMLTGAFIHRHWATWSLLMPAGVVMFAAILLLIDSIRELRQVGEIEWSGRVVDIQRALSRLRIAKVRQFKWIILLCPLVGFCGLVVGLQWLLDRLPEEHLILDKLNPWWVAANYAFGLLFIPFGHLIVSLFARQFGNRGWWQRALDGISGAAMTKATAELEQWVKLDDELASETGVQ